MAKRRSVRQLNKDEADDIDDEPEEIGEFEKADVAAIATRKMAVAKRRIVEGSSGPSPLASFAGFSTAAPSEAFKFFQKVTETKPETKPEAKALETKTTASGDFEALKTLNLNCLDWIKQHLDKDPYVVLLPVFKDYEKHLATLKLDQAANHAKSIGKDEKTSKPSFAFLPPNESKKPEQSGFNFGVTNAGTSAVKKTDVVSFGLTAQVKEASPAFGFGLNSVTAKTRPTQEEGDESNKRSSALSRLGPVEKAAPVQTPAFSFGLNNVFNSNKPTDSSLSAFAAAAPPPAATDQDEGGGGEEEEPPVSDFVPVGEDGSVFDIRCKLFVKKDGQFKSIGVGKLHLKPLPSGKTQVIARADTAQGNLLLNVILNASMPLQKTGKNNVLLVCVPTPEDEPPPVPILIRVKGAEERDQLYDELVRLRDDA